MYPQGRKEWQFTATTGVPYIATNVTTGLYRTGPAPVNVMVRALAFMQTSTGTVAPAIRVYLASAGHSTATTNIVDVITLTTAGTGRGKTFFVDGLRTIVSAGSDLYARVATTATKVTGRLVAYVDVQPFDLANNSRATESA